MSTCSALPSMAKREDRPRDTGDSKMKLPPCLCAAIATRTQLLTIAFARRTVAGSVEDTSTVHRYGRGATSMLCVSAMRASRLRIRDRMN
eukprot:6108520-Pleurochrysis_carterae.AAC.1